MEMKALSRDCMLALSLFICLCASLSRAEAADTKNRFVVLGFGSESCGTYVADRNTGKDNPYRGWLTGYLSSYNEHTKNTYNILGSSDVEAAMLWVENYCKQHPLESFSEAARALLSELNPRKQTTKP